MRVETHPITKTEITETGKSAFIWPVVFLMLGIFLAFSPVGTVGTAIASGYLMITLGVYLLVIAIRDRRRSFPGGKQFIPEL